MRAVLIEREVYITSPTSALPHGAADKLDSSVLPSRRLKNNLDNPNDLLFKELAA